MHRCTSYGRTPASRVAECLKTLELAELPTRESLKMAFYSLLKAYHPDRNPQRIAWAHERTRLIIEAAAFIKNYLENPSMKEPYPPHSEQRKKYPDPSENEFQLLEGETNYAIPVHFIDAIAAREGDNLKKNIFGYYIKYYNNIYPVERLAGDSTPRPESCPYFILISSEKGRSALAVPGGLKFGAIERFRACEVVRFNSDSFTDSRIMFRGKCYLYPVMHFAQEPAVRSAAV